jgi:hypothetical protein
MQRSQKFSDFLIEEGKINRHLNFDVNIQAYKADFIHGEIILKNKGFSTNPSRVTSRETLLNVFHFDLLHGFLVAIKFILAITDYFGKHFGFFNRRI